MSDHRLAALAEPRDDAIRMLLGPLLVVGIVEQAGDRPGGFVARACTVAMRRPPHDGLDRACVISQRSTERPFVELPLGVFVRYTHDSLPKPARDNSAHSGRVVG